jgi:DNA polymerase (family 10)
MPVQNIDIADIFYEIADLLEIEGANPFRIRAYRDAARTIEGHPRRLYEMVDSDESLKDIPGIGEDLAKKIEEIVTTGNLAFYEKLLSRTPHSLIQLLDISGLGPKRVQKLYQELGITNTKELRAAIESGKVTDLEGFGKKTVENILKALDSESFQNERTRLDIAEQFVNPLVNYLRHLASVSKVIIAGSYRRRKPTVGDLDIIVVSEKGQDVAEAFVNYDSVSEILSQGETKSSVKLRSGLQVDLRIVSDESYGAALLYFTGSKAHNIHLRNMAVDRELKLNEYGVFKSGERILGKTEEEIYRYFDMPYIEPELRKDTGEIKAALNHKLPKLIELNDIRGDLQMHTVSSDGDHTVAEMAEAAEELGYEYIAITDHSAYIGVTKGLKADEIEEYIENIDAFNNSHEGVKVLKGIEVDIHEDGSLDLPDGILKKLDIVLGSIHSHFNLSETKQTKRILRAIENPYFNILAHPTTRRIGSRDPISLDMERVMKAALENGCFLEINASPERLDLWDQYIRLAGEMGLKLSISTDSHRTSGLSTMKYGVYQARRGWAEKSQIINTRPLNKLLDLLDRS